MEEEEFEFELEVSAFSLSRRFRKPDLTVLALHLVAGIAAAISETLTAARDCAVMHANYSAGQDIFHEEAALEIETLTSGETDG